MAQPWRSAFPEAPPAAELRRGVAVTGADDGVVGESPGSAVWAQALINHLFRGCTEGHTETLCQKHQQAPRSFKRKWHLTHRGIVGNPVDL